MGNDNLQLHPTWLDQLDQAWDRKGSDEPTSFISLDRSLLETIEQLHALDHNASAPIRGDQIWQRMMTARAASSPAVAPRTPTALWPKPRRRFWNRLADGAAAALLIVAILGSLAVLRMNRAPVVAPAASPSYRLLISDETGDRLLPLDPLTLNDAHNGQIIAPATPAANSPLPAAGPDRWVVSTDGSTLLRIDQRQAPPGNLSETQVQKLVTLTVIDARSGKQRSRFHPIMWGGWLPLISADGRWIVVGISGSELLPLAGDVSHNTSPRWYVYQASDGRLVSIIQSLDPAPWPDPVVALIDSGGERFYHLVIDRHASYPGPWPVQLVVNDMRTGAELGRLSLSEILAGERTGVPPSCENAQQPNGESLYFPGAAISPDGQTLAVVAPDARTVTLVDLSQFSVRRTITLTAQATPASSPDEECHLNERNAFAYFAPDSNHLVVSQIDHAGLTSNPTWTIQRPFRLDLTTGRIDAEAPSASRYFLPPTLTIISPDGQWLYSFLVNYTTNGTLKEDGRVTLIRIDAETLKIEAQRTFAGFRSVVILPDG